MKIDNVETKRSNLTFKPVTNNQTGFFILGNVNLKTRQTGGHGKRVYMCYHCNRFCKRTKNKTETRISDSTKRFGEIRFIHDMIF